MSLERSVRRFTVPVLRNFFQVGGIIDDLIQWLSKIIQGYDVRIERGHEYFSATVNSTAITEINCSFSQDQRHKVTVETGGGSYEHTFNLNQSNFQAGDKVSFFFSCAASTNPTVRISDDRSSVVIACYPLSGTGKNFTSEALYDGTNWFIFNVQPARIISWADFDFGTEICD